jgi:hypothetical protein
MPRYAGRHPHDHKTTMLLFIAGAVLAALGLVCALLLLAAPLGVVATTPGMSLWVLFPLFTLIGYTLLAVGSRDPAVKAPTRWLAVPLLLVALIAAVALVGAGAGMLSIGGGSAALWYVLVLGGLLGVVGSAVSGRSASS